MSYLSWIWIGLIVAAIVVEVLTEQLVSVWFIPGSIVAIILDFLPGDILWVWHVIIILALALIGIFLVRRFVVMRFRNVKDGKTNIESIVGEKCVVTEKIDNYAGCGQAKVKGQIWTARGVDEDSVFEEGEVLLIVGIEGVKLICKKI